MNDTDLSHETTKEINVCVHNKIYKINLLILLLLYVYLFTKEIFSNIYLYIIYV